MVEKNVNINNCLKDEEPNFNDKVDLEAMLLQMEESLNEKDKAIANFEQEQEEKAIISYEELKKAVNKNLNTIYKYYDLKKAVLKLDEIHLYDIYAPMVSDFNKNYTFNEAKETVLEALSVLGEDYIKNLNKAFDERWIDIYNNKGKRTGAYSSGFYDTKPYLLLNYEGKYNDVTTLAHELGHYFLNHQLKTNAFYCFDNEILESSVKFLETVSKLVCNFEYSV